jgi:cyclic pyranopterin phosphate synthase
VLDRFGRKIRVLRVSVTKRCDLRCAYCVPSASAARCRTAPPDGLSSEELFAVVEAAVGLGIDRVRLTGGEPLVREDIVEIVERLARVSGLARLSLTTNGQRLARLAAPLAAAGLRATNVSIDALDPALFAEMRRGGSLSFALEGLDAALEAGLETKVNAVVIRGINEGEILPLAFLAYVRPVRVRFLEYMPMGPWTPGNEDVARVVSGAEILARLRERLGPLDPEPRGEADGPAVYFRPRGFRGAIGVITAVTRPFCERCNRIRLLADGRLRPCLFAAEAIDLKPAIRAGRQAIEAAFLRAVAAKPEGGARARLFPLRMTGG